MCVLVALANVRGWCYCRCVCGPYLSNYPSPPLPPVSLKKFLMNLNKEVASLLQYDGPHLSEIARKLILVTTANGKVSKKLAECVID